MNLANDLMLSRMPWIESEQIHLAATHGETDECDDVASGGAKGDGVYPVGTIELPIHPLCCCFKGGVVGDLGKFGRRVRAYAGGGADKEMQRYTRMVGGALGASLTGVAVAGALGIFYGGSEDEMDERFWYQDAEDPIAEALA